MLSFVIDIGKILGSIPLLAYLAYSYIYRDKIHRDYCGRFHRDDGPAIEFANGDKEWYRYGKLHREDGPAIERAKHKEWYKNGKLHREDGPAIEYANGDKKWYKNGKLHRKDGPSVEYTNIGKLWYQNGLLHRIDGPAAEFSNGTIEYHQNGQLHRTDGPAIEYGENREACTGSLFDEKHPDHYYGHNMEYSKGDKHYYQNGKRYRADGPVIEYADGSQLWCPIGMFGSEIECVYATKSADGSRYYHYNSQSLQDPTSVLNTVERILGSGAKCIIVENKAV